MIDWSAIHLEWAERCERYATARLKAAKRARSLSLAFPAHEASAWRAYHLTRIADAWLHRALVARQEASQ